MERTGAKRAWRSTREPLNEAELLRDAAGTSREDAASWR
jgi:hypothetical protein